jgi:hypothetical protein
LRRYVSRGVVEVVTAQPDRSVADVCEIGLIKSR